LLRRMADLARIEPHRREPVLERQRLPQRLHRRVGAQVAQEAEDEPRADAETPPALVERAAEAVDDRLERHAAAGVRLRVEEDLRVPNPLTGDAPEVRPREVVKILLPTQHPAPGIVDVEERLQVAEDIRPTDRLDRVERQLDIVATR